MAPTVVGLLVVVVLPAVVVVPLPLPAGGGGVEPPGPLPLPLPPSANTGAAIRARDAERTSKRRNFFIARGVLSGAKDAPQFESTPHCSGLPRVRGISRLTGPDLSYVKKMQLLSYQTRHALTGAMGCPALQPKAVANSGMLSRTPFTRMGSGECGSVCTSIRVRAGRIFEHQFCA